MQSEGDNQILRIHISNKKDSYLDIPEKNVDLSLTSHVYADIQFLNKVIKSHGKLMAIFFPPC